MKSTATTLLDRLVEQGAGVRFRRRPDGTLAQLDAGIERWTGLSPDELIEAPDRFRQVVRLRDELPWPSLTSGGASSAGDLIREFCFRHIRTGRLTAVREFEHGGPSQGGSRVGADGFWLDVTARHVLERHLEKAAWYEALTHITAGAAHDLNNCLTGILPLSEDCLMRLANGEPLQEEMELIKESAQKAVRLTRSLEGLLHQRPGQAAYHDLNALAEETVELLRRTVRRRVQIVSERHSETLPIHGDGVELRRAGLIIGLALALRVRGEGRLTMRTAPVGSEMAPDGAQARQAQWTMRLEGAQIDDIPLEQLADPCYLLEAPRPGLGWGLAAARTLLARQQARLALPAATTPEAAVILTFELADLD